MKVRKQRNRIWKSVKTDKETENNTDKICAETNLFVNFICSTNQTQKSFASALGSQLISVLDF